MSSRKSFRKTLTKKEVLRICRFAEQRPLQGDGHWDLIQSSVRNAAVSMAILGGGLTSRLVKYDQQKEGLEGLIYC